MPGRDHVALVDIIGIALIVAAIAASLLHGALRIILGARG
jgi:hypothetical protein